MGVVSGAPEGVETFTLYRTAGAGWMLKAADMGLSSRAETKETIAVSDLPKIEAAIEERVREVAADFLDRAERFKEQTQVPGGRSSTIGARTGGKADAYRQAAKDLLASLDSYTEQGGGEKPSACSECDHSIAPGASHDRGCSRHPSNAYGALQVAVSRCGLAGISRDVMHQVVENFSTEGGEAGQ